MSSTEGKEIKCRAAVVWEKGGDIRLEQVRVEPPGEAEVRIKMVSTGICHSDVNMISGADPILTFPAILGHEGAGVVESVGPGVEGLKPGDHVIPLFLPSCGVCRICKSSKGNICLFNLENRIQGKLPNGSSRVTTLDGKRLYPALAVGTFAEYIVVHKYNVTKITSKAPLVESCLVGCCVPTGYGSAVVCARVKPGSVCAVWGLGGVGANVVLGCRDRGAARIIGIDTDPRKFALVKRFGCTEFLNPRELEKPIEEVLKEMTDGLGPDYTLVSVGNPNCMNDALRSVREGGKSIAIGVTHHEAELTVPARCLLMGRTWKGNLLGGYRSGEGVRQLAELFAQGQLPVKELITHRFSLEDVAEGFATLHRGEAIRSIVVF